VGNKGLCGESIGRDHASRPALIQRLDAAQGNAAQAPQSAPACEGTLAHEHEQEWDRAEALARAHTSSLRAELEAARVKQRQALDQERGSADNLARELNSVRAELDTARAAGAEAGRTAEAAKIERERAFGEERDRRQALARELTSARKEAEERSALLAAA